MLFDFDQLERQNQPDGIHSMRRTRHLSLTGMALICISILVAPPQGMAHQFYISICEMDHNPDTHTLEITFKIFTDDLEQTLEAQGTGKLHLGPDRESEAADRYISRYLEQHVSIEIDGRLLEAKYLGRETESEVTWCYAEIGDVPSISTVTVINTLLIEMFEDQTNVIHIKTNDQKKSMLLTRAKDRGTVEF